MKKKWKNSNWLIMFGVFSGLLAGCGSAEPEGNQGSDDSSATNAETQEAAELEGTFTLYTSQPEEDIQQLLTSFNAHYPEITVEVFRSGTEEVISKVLAEKQVDSVLADVLLVSDDLTFESLKDEDILMAYESPELAGISEDYIDPDGYYAGTKVISTGIAVNTDVIDSEINGFGDLTDPAFQNTVSMPSPLYSGAASYNLSVLTRTEGIGWEWYEELKDNGVMVGQGNGSVQTALLEGTQGVGILVDYMAVRSAADGAPIDFIYPEEGSLVVTEPVGIVNGTDNEELAKAFIDYILSEEGQQVTADIGYTPVREGIEAPEGLRSVTEIEPLTADRQELLDGREPDKERFSALFN